jgi:hypothetical protein
MAVLDCVAASVVVVDRETYLVDRYPSTANSFSANDCPDGAMVV